MSDRVVVSGLKVFGHHGVDAEERRAGQYFLIDVECELDLSKAAVSDDIVDTLDYAELIAIVTRTVTETQFNLIESVAGRLVETVLKDARVEGVSVRVSKPSLGAGVELRRRR